MRGGGKEREGSGCEERRLLGERERKHAVLLRLSVLPGQLTQETGSAGLYSVPYLMHEVCVRVCACVRVCVCVHTHAYS